jgi:hypothetical protein
MPRTLHTMPQRPIVVSKSVNPYAVMIRADLF